MMVATTAFSHRPWLPATPFDRFEDLLRSFTASAMGFAFAAGVVDKGIADCGLRPHGGRWSAWLDIQVRNAGKKSPKVVQ